MPAWIFPSPEGTALEERNVRTVFARLLAKADMRQICIHDLRHTYSTLLLQTGAPITDVSQQPGHRDASITLRVYAHWLPDVSRRVDRLDPLQPDAGVPSRRALAGTTVPISPARSPRSMTSRVRITSPYELLRTPASEWSEVS
jgi:hypothetical protein